MELHDLYARVVIARPELEVPRIVYKPRDGKFNNVGRWLSGTTRLEPAWVAALIESHWLRALPHGYGVIRNYAEAPTFCVVKDVDDGQTSWGHPFDSPLHALAEFHVHGSTSEAKL